MNWHARLLRNELTKLKQGYEKRLDLLATTSPTAKSYLELETERDYYKEELTKTETELTNQELVNAGLTTELTKNQVQVKELAKELLASEKELLNLETHYKKEFQDHESKWKKKDKQQKEQIKILQTNQTENENLLREARKINENLTKERDDYQQKSQVLFNSCQSFLAKQGTKDFTELTNKIKGQETTLSRLVKENGEKQQWISQQKNKLLTAYPLFSTIKELVESSKAVWIYLIRTRSNY